MRDKLGRLQKAEKEVWYDKKGSPHFNKQATNWERKPEQNAKEIQTIWIVGRAEICRGVRSDVAERSQEAQGLDLSCP